MARGRAAAAGETHSSYGTHLLDHLAADGAGLAAGEVAVIALLQVDADLTGRLHLEAIHGLAGVRVHEVVAVGGHTITSPFRDLGKFIPRIV